MTSDLVLLDGGMGRELQRRKLIEVKTVWSGTALYEHPDIVKDIHSDFIQAGAEVITTNNYGVVPVFLEQEGMADRFEELTRRAVELAVAARDATDKRARVAGSLPPLNISYRPDLVGSDADLAEGYGAMAAVLAEGVDLFICETLSTAREAQAAARAGD